MEMHAVRTAMLILVGWICLSPATQGAVSADSRPSCAVAVTADKPELSTRWFASRLPRAAKFVPMIRWKARPKIVLGETDRRVGEEVDLGPALVPDRLISSAPLPWTSSAVAAPSRLRC
jgi:hypothetical protein